MNLCFVDDLPHENADNSIAGRVGFACGGWKANSIDVGLKVVHPFLDEVIFF